MDKQVIQVSLAAFGRRHPEVARLELFGSMARGEAHANSDVDLVVTFAPAWKEEVRGLEFFGYLDALEHDLTVALGRTVHVTDYDAVQSGARVGNLALARAVARDKQLVYEANHTAA